MFLRPINSSGCQPESWRGGGRRCQILLLPVVSLSGVMERPFPLTLMAPGSLEHDGSSYRFEIRRGGAV